MPNLLPEIFVVKETAGSLNSSKMAGFFLMNQLRMLTKVINESHVMKLM